MHLYTILFLLAAVLTILAYVRFLVRKKRLMEAYDETDDIDPEDTSSP